jgi:hypothetical protein
MLVCPYLTGELTEGLILNVILDISIKISGRTAISVKTGQQ